MLQQCVSCFSMSMLASQHQRCRIQIKPLVEKLAELLLHHTSCSVCPAQLCRGHQHPQQSEMQGRSRKTTRGGEAAWGCAGGPTASPCVCLSHSQKAAYRITIRISSCSSTTLPLAAAQCHTLPSSAAHFAVRSSGCCSTNWRTLLDAASDLTSRASRWTSRVFPILQYLR